MPAFARYIGIDYSGAETRTAPLKGLRVYIAETGALPVEVLPPPVPRKFWTRRGIAEWLIERLGEEPVTLVSIDHGFSFSLDYFQAHGLKLEWPAFLNDFQQHWPTDDPLMYVDFIREGVYGNGAARMGDARWRRMTEKRAGRAKSVFHFDVPGSVAKSTHAGIPWLRFVRQRLEQRVHFWPFDGWDIPPERSAITEVYPSLWSRSFARASRSADQHDAYSIAAWLSHADRDGSLVALLNPVLSPSKRARAKVEGWILGVPGNGRETNQQEVRKSLLSGSNETYGRARKTTTQVGYTNKNGQAVLRLTNEPGNDHNQFIYVMQCLKCGHEYGVNGSDIWQRRCPLCGGGAPGLYFKR